MDKYNKLLDLNRIDMESDFTKAVPQKIMASDSNPSGAHLYIEQRAYIAKELEEQGYGNVKQYQNEIKQLKVEIVKLEEFYKIVQFYYEDLDSLAKRLQDDYNGEKPFEQEEQDRLGICYILDHIDEMEKTEDGDYIAQAVKEFAEKLKAVFCTECDYGGGDIKETIDNLITEL